MNRDLSRRIRNVNGITCHKQIVRHDIKLSAKIVHNLDQRIGLWKTETDSKGTTESGDNEIVKKEQQAPEAEQDVIFLSLIHLRVVL